MSVRVKIFQTCFNRWYLLSELVIFVAVSLAVAVDEPVKTLDAVGLGLEVIDERLRSHALEVHIDQFFVFGLLQHFSLVFFVELRHGDSDGPFVAVLHFLRFEFVERSCDYVFGLDFRKRDRNRRNVD